MPKPLSPALALLLWLAWVTIAILIGCVVAYSVMEVWLRGYAYRIDIGIGLIFTAVTWLVIIFLVTIAWHTIRSSLLDPVKVMKE